MQEREQEQEQYSSRSRSRSMGRRRIRIRSWSGNSRRRVRLDMKNVKVFSCTSRSSQSKVSPKARKMCLNQTCKKQQILYWFSLNWQLGRFSHRIMMSICMCVPLQIIHFWRTKTSGQRANRQFWPAMKLFLFFLLLSMIFFGFF